MTKSEAIHRAALDAYLNNLSPGGVESPSAWYMRCLYIGRSGQ